MSATCIHWTLLCTDQDDPFEENRFLLESRVERKIRKGECNHLDVNPFGNGVSCTVGSIPKQSLRWIEKKEEEEEKKMPSGLSIKEAYFLPYLLDGEPHGPALSQDLCPLMYERRIRGMEQQEEVSVLICICWIREH